MVEEAGRRLAHFIDSRGLSTSDAYRRVKKEKAQPVHVIPAMPAHAHLRINTMSVQTSSGGIWKNRIIGIAFGRGEKMASRGENRTEIGHINLYSICSPKMSNYELHIRQFATTK
ncbi:hypothetical protein CEXT_373041 [Caerostris extrusa]|uniref:Uncharacterized protein n=1 Tax=Caerostris extrusa TaxID=172846 RepID=A0AAV4UBM6_CAEEX|nr:hypothetical protein CEXT_373041 [Caerostris extrusa]